MHFHSQISYGGLKTSAYGLSFQQPLQDIQMNRTSFFFIPIQGYVTGHIKNLSVNQYEMRSPIIFQEHLNPVLVSIFIDQYWCIIFIDQCWCIISVDQSWCITYKI